MSVVPSKTTPRDTRRMALVVLLNVVIIGMIVACVGLWFFGTEWSYHLVGDYDLDRGRMIKIYGEQPSIPRTGQLRYEVIVNGEVIVSHESKESEFFETVLSRDGRNPREFSIVPAERGELIAITNRLNDDDIVILHDFRTNQSWPAHGLSDGEGLAVGRRILERLQREYPYFSCSAISAYRPRWVWAPGLARWLVTYPESSNGDNGDAGATRLGVRVFDTPTRRTCFIHTEFAVEEFDGRAAIGWLSDDGIVLAFPSDRILAWTLTGDDELLTTPKHVDEAVRARAAALLESPRAGERFVVPSPILLNPARPASEEIEPSPPSAPSSKAGPTTKTPDSSR